MKGNACMQPKRDILQHSEAYEHVYSYVTKHGNKTVALSISPGLEYLCQKKGGPNASANRERFLELIDSFKQQTASSPEPILENHPAYCPASDMSSSSSVSSDASNPENDYFSQCLILAEDARKYIPAFNEMSRKDFECYSQELTVKSPTPGFAYAAWNEHFPSMVKIGATRRSSPYMRLKELSSTGVPGKFELVACIQTFNPFQVEKTIHQHFNECRSFGKRKEFFEVKKDVVIEYFSELAASLYSDQPLSSDQAKKRKQEQETQAEELQSKVSKLNERLDIRIAENEKLKKKNATLAKEAKKLQETNNALEKTLSEERGKYCTMRYTDAAQVSDLERQLTNDQLEYFEAKFAETEKHQNEVESLKSVISSLEKKIQDLEGGVASPLVEDIDNVSEQSAETVTTNDTRMLFDELGRIRSYTGSIKPDCQAIKQKLDSQQNQVSALTAETAAIKAENAAIKTTLKTILDAIMP